jgi:O-antigen ligase
MVSTGGLERMTSDPRRLQGVVAVMGLGIALGVLVGTEYALVTLAAAVGVAGVVASSVSAGLALGAYLLLLPLCGRVTLFQAVGFPDVTLGRVLAVWLAVVLVARTHPAAWADSQAGRLLYLTFGAFLALVLVAATRAQVLTTGLQVAVDQYVVPLGLCLLAAGRRLESSDTLRALTGFMLAGLVWSGIGLGEFVLQRGLFAANGVLTWSRIDYVRSGGVFINPAVQGTALGCVAVVCLVAVILRIGSHRLAVIAGAASLIGLALTLTRASWLSAAVGLIVVAVLCGRRGLGYGLVAAVMAGAAGAWLADAVGPRGLTERIFSDSPILARVVLYGAAVRTAATSPLLGVGLGRFAEGLATSIGSVGTVTAGYAGTVSVPHNSVLYVAAEMGVPAAGLMVGGWAALIAVFRRRCREPMARAAAVAGLGCLTVFVLNGMFIDTSVTIYLHAVVYVVLGTCAGAVLGSPISTRGAQ